MTNSFTSDEKYLRLKTLINPQGTANVFQILGISNSEIRNSNIISWLLSVDGSHKLKEHFIISLLHNIGASDAIIGLVNANSDQIKTHREYHLSGGYLDIFIEVGNKLNIIIENKIADCDSIDQLRFYQNEINEKHSIRANVFIYLTPSGVKSQVAGYYTLSYSAINSIIQKGLQIVKDPYTESILRMYSDFIQLHYANNDIRQLCLDINTEYEAEIDSVLSGEKESDEYYYASIIRNYSSDLFQVLFDYGKSYIRSFHELKFLKSSLPSVLNFLTKTSYNFQNNAFKQYYQVYNFQRQKDGLYICSWVYKSIRKNKEANQKLDELLEMSDLFQSINEDSYAIEVYKQQLISFPEMADYTIDSSNQLLESRISHFMKDTLPQLDYEFLKAFNS